MRGYVVSCSSVSRLVELTMSESLPEGNGEDLIEGEAKSDREEPAPSDEEDDYEGYFLEPVGNNVNISERIAEANKKLQEEEEEDDTRPRKVQFSEDLVNYLPDYYSDEEDSPRNSVVSEEESELKFTLEETKSVDDVPTEDITNEDIPEEVAEDNTEEEIVKDFSEGANKLLLVLLPKEQNSSCESIIGEEIPEEKVIEVEEKEIKHEPERTVKTRIVRPKSAKKSCEVSKISPNLSYSSNVDRKSWRTCRNPLIKSKGDGIEKKILVPGATRVEIKKRTVKKINIGELNLQEDTLKRCCDGRPKSSYDGRKNGLGDNRPKTAPMRRTCCVLKTELPRYNGFRSEYGLSAEQLQERKQKTQEIKQQKQQEKLKKRQEEIKKRIENEETFRQWLLNKTKKSFRKKTSKITDTLTRSDVYIQTHASYAANRNVPYSVDYSIGKTTNNRKRETWERRNKTILMEKLLDKVSPHLKRSFNIYLGIRRN